MTWTIRPRSDFGALRAIRAGAGPTVVLLHGVGLRAEAWNAQIDALAARYSVIAPDLPGHGESRNLTAAASLGDYADAVAAALDGPTLLAGHSMGALIALGVAVRRPSQVLGVAALNAIYRRDAEAAAAVRRRAAELDGVNPADPSATLARWFGDAASPERQACRDWLSAADPAGYQAAYAVFAAADAPSDAELAGLAAPALFLTGAAEPNATPAMAEAMAALAPRGRRSVVAGAAHMAPMTHAAAVNAALLAFFAECAT